MFFKKSPPHPLSKAPLPLQFLTLSLKQSYSMSNVCVIRVKACYHGKASHAAGSPWDGINALDAAVMAYQAISNLRQQCKPTWRIHGKWLTRRYVTSDSSANLHGEYMVSGLPGDIQPQTAVQTYMEDAW